MDFVLYFRARTSMDDDEGQILWGALREFVGEGSIIVAGTRLYQDLGISGDDALELLDRVHQRFGTKFDGFVFDEYFPNETEALTSHVARILGISSRRKPFTFGHLLQVVRAGAWFDPDR